MSELAKELLPQLDILTAALALFVIVASLGRLYSGLRQFWQDYADGVGKDWIERQHKWLASEDGKFVLANWWLSATGSVCHLLDKIYRFAANPKDTTTPQPSGSLWLDLGSFWSHFLQAPAFIRALFIAYSYFYAFCLLLLASDPSLEFMRWQLVALLFANCGFLFFRLNSRMLVLLILIATLTALILILIDANSAAAISKYLTILITGAFAFALSLAFSSILASTLFLTFVFTLPFTLASAISLVSVLVLSFALTFAFALPLFLASSKVDGLFAAALSEPNVLVPLAIFALSLILPIALYRFQRVRISYRLSVVAALLGLAALLAVYRQALDVFSAGSLSNSPIQLLAASTDIFASEPAFYLMAFILLLLVFPWVNAALDWLSVSASRATFALLQHDLERPSGYRSALRHLGLDVVLALLFKLTLLLLLYCYALLFSDFGVSFDVATISGYWKLLNPLDNVDFSWAAIWSSVDYRFISLMLATTLLPTALHFGWVVVYVTSLSLWWLGRRVLVFTVSDPAVFAAMVSLLITGSALTLLYLVVRSSGAT